MDMRAPRPHRIGPADAHPRLRRCGGLVSLNSGRSAPSRRLVDKIETFIEFEAVVSRNFDVQECHLAINHLRELFGPTLGEPVSAGYIDLMAQALADRHSE